MKKITTIFFLLFICTGCVQSKPTGVQNISEPISMMTGGHMFTASQSLATNNGVYYISNIGQNNNLFYADYNSGKTWFLCSTPGCEHTTEQCSSYVSGSGYVFAGKEKLFYLTCENNKQIIYKMDLSGDNKTKIIPKKAMHYEGAHICGNDDILFTIYDQELVSISAENGEVNTLLHFDTNSEIISAYNNCIYLKKDMPNKYEDQMIPDKFEITEFNVNTGTEKRVYLSHDLQIDKIEEWYIPRLDTAYEFQDEIMYYLERSEGAIHKFNISIAKLIVNY